ncbi:MULTISPECIES: LrgB family protein [Solibacillus]|uniref:LrgB family protein n=1 Tax=Solibacillus TaxID=648800 RepID=UPI002559CAC1|nr:LrgB family protein [Solibacillus isronensis]
MLHLLLILFIISSTVLLFILLNRLYLKVGHPLLLPILTATCITVIILLVFNIPYETYMEGGQWISKMLGPAVVALAFPLYNQRELIFKYKYSIITSIIVAMLAGLISVVALLLLFGSSKDFILTSLPKSLTTPVAMQVSDIVGGIPPLTAVMVMVAGFTGAILGPVLFKLFKIDTAISRGVAMGSASHGVGLTKLKEYSEEDLSIGSLSMGLSAVVGAFIIPLISIYLF